MDGHFLEAFASPFGPGFWCRLGGAGRHYTPSGGSLAFVRAPLRALLGSLGLSRRSLGALWDAMRGFGWYLPLCMETSQTVGFRQFGHHLGATILILGCPWCQLGLFLGSLGRHRGSLGLPLALSWCALCAIWTFF